MATLTRPLTKPTLDDHPEFVRARAEHVEKNHLLNALEARWKQAQSAKQNPDAVVRDEAELEDRALQIEIRRARADAGRAKEAYETTRAQAQRLVTEWHHARIREQARRVIDAAHAPDGPIAEMVRRIEAANADGVPMATLPAEELLLRPMFGVVSGDSYLARAESYLRKTGWLA